MAKEKNNAAKLGSMQNPITTAALERLLEGDLRTYDIKRANLKDGYCDYSYKIIMGTGAGDTHSVSGGGIVMDSMLNAFAGLRPHLAYCDDAYMLSNIDIEKIETMGADELTSRYYVTGLAITGSLEDETVILLGNKYVSSGGRIELKTPKITMDNLSSYKWYKELKEALNVARREVELYKEGNYTEKIEEEPVEKASKKQKNLFEGANSAEGNEVLEEEETVITGAKVVSDADFTKEKLN